MTSQEKEIELKYLDNIQLEQETGKYVVTYEDLSDLNELPLKDSFFNVVK